AGTIIGTTTDTLSFVEGGSTTINWTFDDGNGNSISVPQTYNYDDTTNPVAPTLSAATVDCNGTLTAPTTTDACAGTITGTTSDVLNFVEGNSTTITWTFDDGNGNTTTATQIYNYDDTTAPVTPTLPNVTNQCSVTITAPTTTDDCAGTISGTTVTSFPITSQGTTVVTWTFDDGNGNMTTQTQIVIITDNTAPTFNSCPPSASVNNDSGVCGAVVNFTIPTATDNCGVATVAQTDTTGLTSGDVFPIGTTTIEFTADDGNGNTAICSFNITVTDTESPTITCPSDVIVNADTNCEATTVNLGAPTTNDNCGIASVTNDLASQLPLPIGIHTVTWTVEDSNGLTATCTQQITVQDVTPPVITCPTPNAFYNTDAGQCDATLTFNATASDNCSAAPIIVYEISGSPITFPYNFPVGTTTVNVIANDGNGLSSTCNFDVVVQDNEAPTAICQSISIPLDASGNASILASDIDGGSVDNCSTVTLNASQTTFTCANVGTNNVILTVTDAAGNVSTCNAVVTVLNPVQGATASISSSPGSPICNGTAVTFTATSSNLGASPNYEWFVGGSSVGNNNASYTTTSLTNGDDVYVEITSGPCNTVTTSNSITMTVNPLLPVSFTLNTSANPACTGENLTFFVTGLTNGGATPAYQWYVNGSPVGSNTNAFTSTTISTGDVVSVEVSSNLTCASPIPATESLTMAVNPLPTVTAQANGSSTNITICEGDNLTLTGSGASTYTWDNGVTNGVTFVPTVGTHTYTVTGTSNGCSSTDTIEVTVTPNATITHISGDTNQHVCENNDGDYVTQLTVSTITYTILNATTASVTGLPPGVTYNFNSGTGSLTINGNPNNVATTTTYNYTISTNGCGTATASGSITVYNNPDLETPYGVSGWFGFRDIRGEGYVCLPTVETYYVHNNNDVQYYEWQVPAGCTIIGGAGTNEITVQFSNAYNGNGSIRVRAVNPCDTSSWRSKRVRINPIQSLELNAGNDVIACNDETIHLEGSIVDANLLINSVWLNWDDNGAAGNFINITNNGLNIEYVHPPVTEITTVNISLTAYFVSLLCSEGVTDNMTITIYPDPTATITTPSPVCEGEDVVVSGTPNTTVSYNYNGNPAGTFNIGASGTVTFTGLAAGTYTLTNVQYTNAPSCPETINSSIIINQPATVSAPADITICEGETINLSGATIGGSNAVGTWTSSGSTGTISGSTYTPSPADIFNGSVTLTYTNTPSDGICPAVSDSMVVTINQLPTVDAGVNRTICSTETVTLNGSIGGTATSATWTAPSGSFSNPNDLNATYTPSISTGTVTLTLTSNDPAGPCGPDMDTVVITVNPAATVNAGVDQTICSTETVTLSGSFGGSASTASWTTTGSGIFSGSVYTPSSADITAGSVILTYTTNNPAGVCGIVSDSMLVTINQAASVNAGLDITTCSINATVNLVAVANTAGSWSGGSGTFADANSPNTTYTLGVGETSGTVTLTYTTIDPDGVEPCNSASDAMVITIVPYVSATASNLTTIGSCSDTTIQLFANGSGQWSAVSIPTTSTYSFSNVNDPNATFTGESGVNYTLTWTIDNAAPCADDSATVAVNFPSCGDFIDFDGTDDSVNFGNVYNLSGSFSIEAWIKPSAISNSVKTIISKRDASNLSTGYDLRLVNGTVSFNANGSSITANGITASRWYHIAVTYNGTQYKLYVDGIDRNTRTGPIPSANNYNTLLGAMARSSNTPTNYYSGWMDELRIWNTSLSAAQIRQMMNQEIGNNGGAVHGSTVPLNVSGLTWSNITAYYQMNQGTADISGGNLVANVGTNGRLRNMTTLQEESAPLPYISTQNGNWNSASTWLYGNVQMIPNTNAVTWNIVRTVHNVDSGNRATTVLGLLVDANTVTISNEQSLQVNSYLKIDGVLDLEGESQLLQPTGSIVDYTGTGSLHRDQQGTTNLFNYNYWTSPVSTDGASFKIGNVLYDGTNPVNWVPGPSATGSTNPVTLSSRWLYLYENYPADSYAAWNDIDTNYDVPVGLGFTMKGSGVGHPINDLQNYTFVGKPNNGTIITPVTGGNEALVGNPYPSAIDATQFINDNAGSITGALYFWEHSKTNNSHITIDYEGGYAVRNLLSGVAATSPPTGIGSVGMVGKIPERYVAVAQGFYVTGDSDGGNIIFNNAQRAFKKESEANTSVFFRNETDSEVHTGVENDNLFKLIRLDFSSPEGAVRHLALGFTPNNEASEAVDYGYDALNTDDNPSDMSFQIEDGKYIIQGVGEFNAENMYPVTIDMGMTGNAEIALTDLENFDEDPDVLVYDALLGTYTRINVTPYQTNLDAGTHEGRFYIVFQEDNVLSTETDEFPNVIVNYLNSTNQIYIKVPYSMDIKQVYLVNMLGQTIKSWNSTNAPLSQECKIPVRQLSEGNYIIKVQTTDNQTINKKVIVKMQ
uniref:HYR domain-containing protein n=1 Tax=Bizionia sp. TaxID=1954480 RepID=UPI003A92F63D